MRVTKIEWGTKAGGEDTLRTEVRILNKNQRNSLYFWATYTGAYLVINVLER